MRIGFGHTEHRDAAALGIGDVDASVLADRDALGLFDGGGLDDRLGGIARRYHNRLAGRIKNLFARNRMNQLNLLGGISLLVLQLLVFLYHDRIAVFVAQHDLD